MCGIFGAFHKDGLDESQMQEGTMRLAHRGPDAHGFYFSENKKVFLGHRRLSILDVSAGANQPFYSACGNFIIVYNGEVYNYVQLKNRLPGFAWRTTGDTEVVLELFARFGPSSFSWLNGIFAFSIYNIQDGKLWLCRDQLGVKPLFVRRAEGSLVFASEMKAMLLSGSNLRSDVTFQISKTSVAQFLHLGFIPEPRTIFRGVKKFPAGNYACFDTTNGQWNRFQYWSARDYFLKEKFTDEATTLKIFREKLFEAVRNQMVSDVPLGTFLSGGIDSSLVTAIASKIGVGKVKTFNIGFDDAGSDESVFAGKVAQYLKTDHRSVRVRANDMIDLIPEFISLYDEPFADSSAFPTMVVSKLAAEDVKVVLSGDGGDELFQGYGSYAWAQRLSIPGIGLLRGPVNLAGNIMGERYKRAAKVFNHSGMNKIHAHILSQEQYLFSEAEIKKLMPKKRSWEFAELSETARGGSLRERQALWDIEHYLRDDLLVKVDRAGMYYSLETRVPLLDRDLVEFALSLPLKYKIDPRYGTKYFLKKVLYEMVPQQFFERPKKGFSIPLKHWLASELRPLLDQYLNKQQIGYAGLVEYKEVESLISQFLGGKTYLYNRVWALLVLHWWKRESKI